MSKSDKQLWTCPKCGNVPNVEHDIVIKKWLTLADLEELGYSPCVEIKKPPWWKRPFLLIYHLAKGSRPWAYIRWLLTK